MGAPVSQGPAGQPPALPPVTPPVTADPQVPLRIDDSHAVAVSRVAAATADHAKRFVSRNNVLAAPALVLSCLGLITLGVTALAGAILGHVARKQIRQRGQTGSGLALAAI